MKEVDSTTTTYRKAIVIDGLNVSNWDSPAVYKSLVAGGVTAINATVATWEGYRETLDNVSAWLSRFEKYSDAIVQVETVDDILRAKKDGRVGVILGWQNASPIDNDLDRLELFHRLGVRIVQLTYHERSLLGNGCYERNDYGLSRFGVDAIKEMNRLGILIDLSHVGDRTTLEAIETSDAPVAVTHANSRSYYDQRRNKEDRALKLLAELGGVVGATCIRPFLRNGMDATLEDYLDAIDHLVDLIGIDHVGIGTDFTQDQPDTFWRYIASQQGTKFPSTFTKLDSAAAFEKPPYPDGLQTPDDLPDLATALAGRGYTHPDLVKLLGANWLRLFRRVWK